MAKSDSNVYTHAKTYKIPSGHGPNINYLVCYGYVDWKKNGLDLKPAIYILMEYNGHISYQTPPHILTEKDDNGESDFSRVMEKIELLKKEFNL